MVSEDYESLVWDMILQIFNNCKGKTIKGITVKKSLIHKGGKYKWQDGIALHFSYEKISFTCSFVDYYEDTNDYKQKNLITFSEYSLFKLEGIKKHDVLSLLKAKSRIIKIEKLLNEDF